MIVYTVLKSDNNKRQVNQNEYIFSRQYKITWLLVTWQCEYINKQTWKMAGRKCDKILVETAMLVQ